ncbi:MAG TPA: hypothetical protein DF427_00205 [Moraxellaceae bacterium]|nr:hypothetical protein [Moraxellaceae bacterium]
MNLILSSYLRILKERDELDVLLPDLLVCMGLLPLTKPQTGTRQFGVDLPAIGPDLEDKGKQKLFLFVLKQGDIGRSVWSGDPQSVRQSMDEIFDVYLHSHVSANHKDLPKKIVVCTSGDLKEEAKANWSGYTNDNAHRAEFDFWGADKLAALIERHMLNENIFSSEDRVDLRRTLALVSESDYSLNDFHRLLLRQLGLDSDGRNIDSEVKPKALKKAFTRINLATRVLATWALEEGNGKQAVIAAERALLWTWHRVQLEPESSRKTLNPEIAATWQNYQTITKTFFEKIQDHCYIKDSFSGYARDNAVLSLILMELVGLVSVIGLAHCYRLDANENDKIIFRENANIVSDGLVSLIRNNPTTSSPRLDSNAIDIILAMMLLYSTGRHAEAIDWLKEMVKRLDYTFKINRCFPIDKESVDDLADFEAGNLSKEEISKLKTTSWLLPTLAGWSAILEQPEIYQVLVNLQSDTCKNVCMQLWHPVQDVFQLLYFKIAHYDCGEAEAPILLADNMEEHRQRMLKLIESTRHNILSISPATQAGLMPIDLIASRHFRTFVAPFYWYSLSRPYTP